MAKKKQPFNAAEGLFVETQAVLTQHAHEEYEVKTQEACEKYEAQQELTPPQNSYTLEGTQGRKGAKLPRHTMAFTPVNHAYIKRASRMQGLNMTEFINMLVDEHRDKNKI